MRQQLCSSGHLGQLLWFLWRFLWFRGTCKVQQANNRWTFGKKKSMRGVAVPDKDRRTVHPGQRKRNDPLHVFQRLCSTIYGEIRRKKIGRMKSWIGRLITVRCEFFPSVPGYPPSFMVRIRSFIVCFINGNIFFLILSPYLIHLATASGPFMRLIQFDRRIPTICIHKPLIDYLLVDSKMWK